MLSQGEYQNKILEELLLKVGGSYGKWIGILHDMGVAANASISMSRVKENVKNKHGYLGVCKKNGKSKMYKCWISVNGKSIQRYGFSNAEDAARERDKLTLLYRDDKARLNFPELIEQYRAELAQEENT